MSVQCLNSGHSTLLLDHLQIHSSEGTVRRYATIASRSALVILAYEAKSIGGLSRVPSGRTPSVIARLMSASLQAPIPAVLCDVMFLAFAPSHVLGKPLTSV